MGSVLRELFMKEPLVGRRQMLWPLLAKSGNFYTLCVGRHKICGSWSKSGFKKLAVLRNSVNYDPVRGACNGMDLWRIHPHEEMVLWHIDLGCAFVSSYPVS